MAVELATAYISVLPSMKGFAPAVSRELGTVEKTTAAAGKRAGGGFMSGAKKVIGITGIAGVLGIGKVVKDSVSLEASFSKTMAQVAASTGAPKSELGKMSDLAMKLGADTKFSAGESADAMLELAKAGITTKDIMGGALQGTLTLAAAGDLDLANAATIASNAMNTFNLKGKDMDSIAAALAGGANASSASVESLGQALQQVGPGATNAGLSLQETVATLSAFDAAGIKGSDAGTSLKTMLTRLVPSTRKARNEMMELGLDFTKADGSFQSISNIAQQLKDKLGPLSEEQRTQALATMFGSDATRAATVLMKEGSKGLAKYIKATKDQTAANKMAKANMSGTAGALEQLSGAWETAQLALGKALAPGVQKGAKWLSDEVIPAVSTFVEQMSSGKGAGGKFADFVGDLADAFKDLARNAVEAAKPFADTLIPAFKIGLGIIGKLAKVLDDIPDPLKQIAIQAALGTLAFKKMTTGIGFLGGKFTLAKGKLSPLTTGLSTMGSVASTTFTDVKSLRGEMGTFKAASESLRTNPATAGIKKLGGAVKTVAGPAGMMLLVTAFQKTSQEGTSLSGVLTGTVGGAMLGLAVGGPIGALIGAAAGGGLMALVGAFHKDKEAAWVHNQELAKTRAIEQHKEHLDRLKDTLNEVTGATTRATRAEVDSQLQSTGAYKAAAKLGINKGLVFRAAMQEEGALKKVNAAIWRSTQGVGAYSEESQTLIKQLGLEREGQRNKADELRDAAARQGRLNEVLKVGKRELQTWPKVVRTRMEDNFPATVAEVQDVARGVKNLDKKQIRIMLKSAGLKDTPGNIKAVEDAMRGVQKQGQKGSGVGPWKNDLNRQVGAAAAFVKNEAEKIARDLGNKPGSAKPNLTPYQQRLVRQLDNLTAVANDEGEQVGDRMGAGVQSGMEARIKGAVETAARLVRSMAREANKEADAHSPSRVMMELGSNMGLGLAIGMEGTTGRVTTAGTAVTRAAMAPAAGARMPAPAPTAGTAPQPAPTPTPAQPAPRRAEPEADARTKTTEEHSKASKANAKAFRADADSINKTWKQRLQPVYDGWQKSITKKVAPTVAGFNKQTKKTFTQTVPAQAATMGKKVRAANDGIRNNIRGRLSPSIDRLNTQTKRTFTQTIPTQAATMGKNVRGQATKTSQGLVTFGGTVSKKVAPAFGRGVDAVGQQWNRVRNVAKGPVKYVVGTVLNNGLLRAFNKVAKFVNTKGIDPIGLPGFETGGYTGRRPKHAVAGVVHGDEHVIRAESRREIERAQPGFLDRLNRRGLKALGDIMPGYKAGGVVWPTTGRITSTYSGHDGVDINGPGEDYGNPIFAFRDGTISYVGSGRGYGAPAIFENTSVGEVVYGHASSASVGAGQRVKAGQVIGRVGSTGNSTGPHLHFGYPGGTYSQALALLRGATSIAGAAAAGAIAAPALPKWAQKIVDDPTKWAKDHLATNLPGGWGKTVGGLMNKLVEPAADWASSELSAYAPAGGMIGSAAATGPVKAYAKKMLAAFGWGPEQFGPLNALWNRESGWRTNADNPSSTAYGIPQMMLSVHNVPGDYRTNPYTQIKVGLNYIKGRYGSPAAAWGHSQSVGWYGDGLEGGLFTKPTVIGVGERGPERVDVTPLGRRTQQARRYAPADQRGRGGARRYAMTITNWDEGVGYIAEIAEDQVAGNNALDLEIARASR